MKYYLLRAALESPLNVQKNRQSNMSLTMDHLPGSTLRGAVAAQYLRQGGSATDDDFQTCFIRGPICFPNLLPSDTADVIPSVLPLTSYSCKRKPGFKVQGGHGVFDTLIPTAYSRMTGEQATADGTWTCNVCAQDKKPFTGYWNNNIHNPEKYRVSMCYQRHTGIDRLTGTGANSIFYATQAISECRMTEVDPVDQYLAGGAFLTDDQFAALNRSISDGHLYVGADKTRGYGMLTLTIKEADEPKVNIEQWNTAFHTRYKSLCKEDAPAGLYFSVKTESPAILVDRLLRPDSSINLPDPEIKPLLQVAKAQIIRGWNNTWGLPKPDDVAIAPGSVYLFRYEKDDMEDMKKIEEYLSKLVVLGIGLRREEGFGRISICDSIHVEEVI